MKLYMFRTVLCPSSGVYSLYTQQWCMLYRFVDSFRAWAGCSILVLIESCLQNSMTYTIAECTVNKLLMMDRELSETCRFSWQNKCVKLVPLVGFIIKKYPIQFSTLSLKWAYSQSHFLFFEGQNKDHICRHTLKWKRVHRVTFLIYSFL